MCICTNVWQGLNCSEPRDVTTTNDDIVTTSNDVTTKNDDIITTNDDITTTLNIIATTEVTTTNPAGPWPPPAASGGQPQATLSVQHPTTLPGCVSQPCQNAYSCYDNPNGASYGCLCNSGFTGINCESDINECQSNPCQNHGKEIIVRHFGGGWVHP